MPVTSSGTVNLEQVGAYTLSDEATDAAGNHAVPVVREVLVSEGVECGERPCHGADFRAYHFDIGRLSRETHYEFTRSAG